MRNRKRWLLSAFVFVALMMLMSVTVQAKKYSENGTWKKKIGKNVWYFDVNNYTSGTPDEDPNAKYYGVVYIYKGTKNYKNRNKCAYAEYYKVGTNKYRIKYKKGMITFTVREKSLKLKQNKGKVKGTKLRGVFKLDHRHYS